MSVDISVEARPICRSTSRPIFQSRGVGRASVNMSTDMSTSMSAAMSTDVDRYDGRYSGLHSADILTVEYRSSVGGLSVDCRWSINRLSYDINQKFRLSVSDL